MWKSLCFWFTELFLYKRYKAILINNIISVITFANTIIGSRICIPYNIQRDTPILNCTNIHKLKSLTILVLNILITCGTNPNIVSNAADEPIKNQTFSIICMLFIYSNIWTLTLLFREYIRSKFLVQNPYLFWYDPALEKRCIIRVHMNWNIKCINTDKKWGQVK